MPRVSKSIQENVLLHPQLSKILFFLSEQEDNSQGLANRKIGTTQGILYTHLKRLEEEKYVLKSDFKRGAYKVNIDYIIEKFYLFLFEEKIQRSFNLGDNIDEIIEGVMKDKPEMVKELNLLEYKEFISEEFKKKFVENNFMRNLLLELFATLKYDSIFTLFTSLHTYVLFENLNSQLEDSIYIEEFINGKEVKEKYESAEEEVNICKKKGEDFINNNEDLNFFFYIFSLLQKLSSDRGYNNVHVTMSNLLMEVYIKSKNE